jgi:hypothetical protein
LNLIETLSTDESPSILEAAWPDEHKLNALIQSTWPCQSDAVLANDSPSPPDKAAEELHEGTTQPQARMRQRILPNMDAVPLDLESATAPAANYDEALELPTFNPYVITRAEQLADPNISPILQRLERSEKLALKADPLWKVVGGRLFRRGFSSTHEATSQIYVPTARRSRLLEQYHYSNHRGGGPLEDELAKSYYWPNLSSDCTTFSLTCEVCGQLAAAPLNKAATNPIPTPARPFTVLHVDHADFRGRSSGPR